MKAAITTLNSNLSTTTIGIKAEDTIYLRFYMMHILKYEKVDFLKYIPSEEGDENVQKDWNEYDEIIIYNSAIHNIFGGRLTKYQHIVILKLLEFKGKIKYFIADPKLNYIDYGLILKKKVENGSLKTDLNNKILTIEECERFINEVSPRISYIFSGSDYNLYKSYIKNSIKNYFRTKNQRRGFI